MKVDRVSLSFDRRLGLGSCRGVVGNVYFSISNGFVEERQEVGWLVTSADVSMVKVEDMAIGIVSVGAKLKDTKNASHNKAFLQLLVMIALHLDRSIGLPFTNNLTEPSLTLLCAVEVVHFIR